MNEQQLAAVKQALEALESERDKYLEWGDEDGAPEDVYEAITALQSIISQDALDKKAENARELGLDYEPAPVQEPVAKVYRHGESSNGTPWHGIKWLDEGVNMPDGTLLYATPQPVPVQEPWKPSDTANRIGGLPQDFIEHKVENEGDWSEWVNPDSEQYFMKCCDCGLVHEMQFKVVKYSEGDECEFIDDADLQAVFRARRATPPAAQKPWVNLTDEEMEDLWAIHSGLPLYRAIEAKLKEKNHD